MPQKGTVFPCVVASVVVAMGLGELEIFFTVVVTKVEQRVRLQVGNDAVSRGPPKPNYSKKMTCTFLPSLNGMNKQRCQCRKLFWLGYINLEHLYTVYIPFGLRKVWRGISSLRSTNVLSMLYDIISI